jgi:hypothetical protein
MIIAVGVGLIAGIGLVIMLTLSSLHPYYTVNVINQSSSSSDIHIFVVSKDNTTNWQTWVDDWASSRNAEIITINGHKAAVHGIQVMLRGDELVFWRSELVSVDDKFEYEIYGFVPESALIQAAQETIKAGTS